MDHHFDIDLAKEYGIEEAIIIKNFDFWLSRNKANGSNHHEGTYWTYNSAKAFSLLFPYMSPAKVRRVMLKLQEKGVIRIGNFNQSAYDRTQWYSFTETFCDSVSTILQFCRMEDPKVENGSSESVTPIPDSKPDSKPIKKQVKKKSPQTPIELWEAGGYEKHEDFVYLHPLQLRKMIDAYGEENTKAYILKLDTYMTDHPEKSPLGKNPYRDHYKTMRNWMNKEKLTNPHKRTQEFDDDLLGIC